VAILDHWSGIWHSFNAVSKPSQEFESCGVDDAGGTNRHGVCRRQMVFRKGRIPRPFRIKHRCESLRRSTLIRPDQFYRRAFFARSGTPAPARYPACARCVRRSVESSSLLRLFKHFASVREPIPTSGLRDASRCQHCSQCFPDRRGSSNGNLASRCAHGYRDFAGIGVRNCGASVIACEVLDRIPMCEIGIAVNKRFRAAFIDNFRSFVLRNLGHSR
jgi:hypothetical protein